MSFLSCGHNFQQGYELRKRLDKGQEVVEFIPYIDDINISELEKQDYKITQIKKSQCSAFLNQASNQKSKFVDPEFQPILKNFGDIEHIKEMYWKRISQFVKNPVLLQENPEPKDIFQGQPIESYFESAIAALIQDPKFLNRTFENQKYNTYGIYQIKLKVGGVVKEIIVDDYIPVNFSHRPFFCQPNKNCFWLLILEKAWAKVHGSYANIINGSCAEVLQSFTFSPSQALVVSKNEKESLDLWLHLKQFIQQGFPICCTASQDNNASDFIMPNLIYTMISAQQVEHQNGKKDKIVKLRNPQVQISQKGVANFEDETFWSDVIANANKKQFFNQPKAGKFGLFSMLYDQFLKRFCYIETCNLNKNGNYICDTFQIKNKNGILYQFNVTKNGKYFFQVHLPPYEDKNQKLQQGQNRMTLLIIKVHSNQKKQLEYLDGSMKFTGLNLTLLQNLSFGSYLLYVKIEPTRKSKFKPKNPTIGIYSQNLVRLIKSDQKKYENLLQNAFIGYAKNNKTMTFKEELWISSKILFQNGGYAFIVIANESDPNERQRNCFIIQFNQEQFVKQGFKLKKNYKGKGNNQKIEVNGGQIKIILCRVKNQVSKKLKFPPKISIGLQKKKNY